MTQSKETRQKLQRCMIHCGDRLEGVGAFISQRGQGLRGSDVGLGKCECQGRRWGQNLNLYKHCPSPICGVKGLCFPFGKIGGSESIVLGTGLSDIRSSNQYKIIRAL